MSEKYVCKICVLSVFAGALTVQACSMKWLHDGPADNKESKICCFGTLFYLPSKYCPPPPLVYNFVVQPTRSSIDTVINIVGTCCTCRHHWMLVYNGRQQKTCLKKEYHIIDNATKTSLVKHIKTEQRTGIRGGGEQVVQPSLNKRRQEDHLPLVY